MYFKREFIPEERSLFSNYIVIDNAKLIKEDQESLNNIDPVYADEPLQCFKQCTEVGSRRCNIVEYNLVDKSCKFYDLPKDDNVTLKFKYSDSELNGDSFTISTVKSIKKQGITKEECINIFNSNTENIFYNYKEDGSFSECIVGIPEASKDYSFAINLNSFNSPLKFVNPNKKYQMEEDVSNGKAGTTKEQKEGGKGGNSGPLILVAFGIIGVIVITGLIYYGIRMVKKANKLNSANNSRNVRNQISYKLKNSDPYSSGSRGSKNSTLNNSSKRSYNVSGYSYTNKSQHSTISNIAPQIYDYNDSETYINSGGNSYPNSLPNSYQSNTLQDFYNNASLSFGVSNYPNNYGNNNYGSSYGTSINYNNYQNMNNNYSGNNKY